MTKAPVTVVKKDSSRYIKTLDSVNFSDLLRLNGDILDSAHKTTVFVIETNLNSLLAVNCVRILAVSLTDSEAGELAILLLEFISKLIDTLSL